MPHLSYYLSLSRYYGFYLCLSLWSIPTFFDVLIFVGRLQLEVVVERAEGVDEVGAEVGVDVGRLVPGQTLSVHRPVGVVAHHTPPRPLHGSV